MVKKVFNSAETTSGDFYQSLYSVGEPVLFPEMVAQSLGYNSKKECPQEEFWTAAEQLALEFAVCPANVDIDDFEPNAYDMAADRETLYIYIVNYKGEGEGYFRLFDVKSRIVGKFVAKKHI